MSKEHMGEENVKAFDTELLHILSDFVDDERTPQFPSRSERLLGEDRLT